MKSKYQIKIKRDFPKYDWYDSTTRSNKHLGFVVVKDGCNCIPGACWFRTIEDAMLGIEIHMKTGDTPAFHTEWKKMREKRD